MSQLMDPPKNFEALKGGKEPVITITFRPERISRERLAEALRDLADALTEQGMKSTEETSTFTAYTLPCTINGVPGAGCQTCWGEPLRCGACKPPPCI